MKLKVTLLLLAAAAWGRCYADITTYYVVTHCSEKAGTADIAMVAEFDEAQPPDGAHDLSELAKRGPFNLCSFGPRMDIQLHPVFDGDRPVVNHVDVRVGTRLNRISVDPAVSVGTSGDPTEVHLKHMDGDHFVHISACVGGKCIDSIVTEPSFDCSKFQGINKGNDLIDDEVCTNEALSELDLKLNSAYQNKMKEAKDRVSLRETEIAWLKSRLKICWSAAPLPDFVKVDNCLIKAYNARIDAISFLSAFNPGKT